MARGSSRQRRPGGHSNSVEPHSCSALPLHMTSVPRMRPNSKLQGIAYVAPRARPSTSSEEVHLWLLSVVQNHYIQDMLNGGQLKAFFPDLQDECWRAERRWACDVCLAVRTQVPLCRHVKSTRWCRFGWSCGQRGSNPRIFAS